MLQFEFVSPPSRAALVAALEQLLQLGALDSSGKLTADGHLMAKLPLDPMYAKALIEASRTHDCISPVLSLVAMLSTEGAAFVSPPHARERADEARRRFTSTRADTLTMVNVLTAFGTRRAAKARAWCDEHFVNRRTVESARLVRDQLVQSSRRLGLLTEKHAAAEAAQQQQAQQRANMGMPLIDEEIGRRVRRCLSAAFFLNAAQRQPSGEYIAVVSHEAVAIHPSSALFSKRAPCVLFNELLYTTKLYMRDLTSIDAEWLTELVPGMYTSSQ